MLEGMKQIGEFLGGMSPKRVRTLARSGAPIRVVGEGDGRRYIADSDALHEWLTATSGNLRPASAS